jgi:hypothetical protein
MMWMLVLFSSAVIRPVTRGGLATVNGEVECGQDAENVLPGSKGVG